MGQVKRKLPVGSQSKLIKVDIIDDLCRNEFAFQRYESEWVPTLEIISVRCARKMNHTGDCLVQNPNNNEWYWIHGATRDPGTELVLKDGVYMPYKEKERE
jgi:hypothetical protein